MIVGITMRGPENPFTSRRSLVSCGWNKSPCVKDYQCCDALDLIDNNCNGVENQDEKFRNHHIEVLSSAVAKMRWWDGNWRFSCTASLINNADNRVLLMTANHCISKSNDSLELYFNEKSYECQSSCDYNFGMGDTIGMKVLSTSSKSDYTLFESKQALPNNGKIYTALGWNSDPVQKGDRQYRIQ